MRKILCFFIIFCTVIISTFNVSANSEVLEVLNGKATPIYYHLIDVAVGKPVAVNDAFEGQLAYVNDTYTSSQTVSTGVGVNYIQIDLLKKYPLKRIDLLVSNTLVEEKNNFSILLSNTADFSGAVVAKTFTDDVKINGFAQIPVDGSYRYVRAMKTKPNERLGIYELRAMSNLPVAEVSRGRNVMANNGTVDASWAAPEMAVDGNANSRWIESYGGNNGYANWFNVDFNGEYQIDQIEYLADPYRADNTENCCFDIKISNTTNGATIAGNTSVVGQMYPPEIAQGLSLSPKTAGDPLTAETAIFGVANADVNELSKSMYIGKNPDIANAATYPNFSAAEIRALTVLPEIIDYNVTNTHIYLYYCTNIDESTQNAVFVDNNNVEIPVTLVKDGNGYKADITQLEKEKTYTLKITGIKNRSGLVNFLKKDGEKIIFNTPKFTELENSIFTIDNNENADFITSTQDISFSTNMTNNSNFDKNVIVMLWLFDNENCLIKTVTKVENLKVGVMTPINVAMNVKEVGLKTNYKARAMIWESKDKINPYTNKFEIVCK